MKQYWPRGSAVQKLLLLIFSVIGLTFMASGLAVFFSLRRSDDQVGELLGGIFTLIGAAFVAVAVVFVVLVVKRSRLNKRLVEEGSPAYVPVEEVYQIHYMRINSRYPFVIRCRDAYTGIAYESGYFMRDPRPLLAQYRVESIPVYTDRGNHKRYYMDVESLNLF